MAFIGSVIFDEVKNYGAYKSPLYIEPLTSVGQWSTVAIIGLVITAAVVSKVSERPDQAGEIHDGNFQGIVGLITLHDGSSHCGFMYREI